MPATEKRTISLPGEQSAFIDAKIAAGDYASASEVVRAGLRALRERDEAVRQWLVEAVVPTYNAMKANPSLALSSEAVIADIRARHAERVKDAM